MSSFWVKLLVVVAVMAVSYGQATPEQFHIALAGSNGMSISWFTAISTEKSECRYGTTVESLGSKTNEYSCYIGYSVSVHTFIEINAI
jgi:hypothetical protein